MSARPVRFTVLCFGLAVLIACQLPAQQTADRKRSGEFDVSSSQKWVDTGLDVVSGDSLKISATGGLRYLTYGESGPEGRQRGWRDLLRILPLNDANHGALIGRIGSDAASRPFLIGGRSESRPNVAGRLFLGLNQMDSERADGSLRVTVEIAAGASAPGPPVTTNLPVLTQELLDRIPVRVTDAAGSPGDRVNFLVIGAEARVKQALQDGGWVQVNRSAKDALIQAALATFSRQAYTQLPMSELRLYDRPQDYGYAQADPLVVVAARHHFRLWKAPFQVDGQSLWVGAGTHDVGFDRDRRSGKITHKIDPDTDKEREFIGASLEMTGAVAKLSYMTPAGTLTGAKTAHGQSFRTDGRTLVIVLRPDLNDKSRLFADLFCTVLREKNPDGGEWGACSSYLETPAAQPEASAAKKIELGPIPDKYRLLIVPGLMNTCFAGAPAYKEGQEYLRQKYGLTVEILPVPNDSSEDNARKIGDYIREKTKEDARKYIVLGYSKGTPDLQVALADEPDVAPAVAAFINVAGASGGSPVADAIPGIADRWIRQYGLPGCKGDLAKGFKSLSQMVRRAFLSRHPDPIVPTYSLPAVSDQSNTSKMLMQTWQLLKAFGDSQDSQLARADAIIPGSKYLGSALADHFAVALPFETSNESVRSGADKNHYPRTALLEAMVRFVIQDLEGPR